MKKLFFVVAMLMLVSGVMLMSATPTYAEEPAVGTPEDNACNPGGVMEGKCDTDWEWGCGYYLARWISAGGWGGNYAMNTDCVSLLPPVPVVAVTEDGSVAGVDAAQVAAIIEICKIFGGGEYCLYSNQTGTQATVATGVIFADSIFHNNGLGDANCPPVPPTATALNISGATTGFNPVGFTNNELFTVLGLEPHVCSYSR